MSTEEVQPAQFENNISQTEQIQEGEKPPVSFLALFRFATLRDKILMVIGALIAVINGFALPAWTFIFGQMVDEFNPASGYDGLIQNAGVQAMWFGIIGGVSFILSGIQMGCWMYTGERQTICYRRNYFKAILKQEIGWFDKSNPHELATKIATECLAIQGAISEKVTTCIMTISMFFAGFIVAFIRGWLMSLVASSSVPILFFGGMIVSVVIKKSIIVSFSAYTSAGGVAEQALNAVKTVKSLNGEEYELKNYSQRLIEAFKTNVKLGAVTGFGIGLTFCCMFLSYSLSFWYGGKLIHDGTENSIFHRAYTSGDVLVCFFSILMGGFTMGQVTPCLNEFMKGRQAAVNVFSVIDRVPLIQNPSNPKRVQILQGKFEFKNVTFSYPMKPDVKALNNISFEILPNQKTAIVGESGSGKSTIMQLLERFYDPEKGEITLDGICLKELELKWMRNEIGYVGQEPVLFAATIRENLQFGNLNATEQEMIGALKQTNAWQFVQQLEKGLDTYVGNMGSQFSGGQKQRICIARAILKNPKILLLDEATSALDRKNEREIQETLDYVSTGRTTIVVAHRLMTVKNANKVIVLDEGSVVEQGSFQELMNLPNSKFVGMAKNQIIGDFNEDNQNEQNLKVMKTLKNKSYAKFDMNHSLKDSYRSNRSISDQNNGQVAVDLEKKENEKKDQLTDKELNFQKNVELKRQSKEDKVFVSRLFKMNKPEQGWFYLGCLVTLANGTLFPLAGLLLGEFLSILSDPSESDFIGKVNLLAVLYVVLAFSSLILYMLQIYLFSRVGEGLTLRIRQEAFMKMLRMPCGWFDDPTNTPGILASRLFYECQIINVLTTNVMALQFQNLSTLLSGLIIAFVASWRVTLVGLGCMPIMFIAGSLQSKFAERFNETSDQAYKGSGNIITDAVTNIRTVASFANEQKIMELMEEQLHAPASNIHKKSIVSGLMFGFSQFSVFGIYAIIFYVSAYFVRDYGDSIKDMYISMFCILFAGFGAGSNNAFVGDIGAAKVATRNIFKIIDAEDEIQIQQKVHSSENRQLVSQGRIVFDKVSFKYPTRDQFVFKDLSFTITPGQHIAFVGPSGCGKSTIMQILLRFYDDYTGAITIDGVDIRQYDIASLRSNFGVVFQDPILFDTTFKENIKYNTFECSMEDIRFAASQANALNFIEGNEKKLEYDENNQRIIPVGAGFERKVGIKGSQISGGQKQRIAVARAIIKQPKIMLLDEATSALDQENEDFIQQALSSIMVNKTCISIAHKINTIKDSDIIFVMHEGEIKELGKFDDLMKLQGFFYNINHL